MAQLPKFRKVPALRRRASFLKGQTGQEQDFITRTELLDLLRNLSESTVEIDASDTVRDGEPLRTVVQYLGADGKGTNSNIVPVSIMGNVGSAIASSPLTAADVGSDATITIAAFTLQKDDGTTASVSGASVTGLAFSTVYRVYLTDFNRDTGAYTSALATTSDTTLVSDPDNLYVGSITTPANGAGGTSGTGGGGVYIPEGIVP